MKKETLKKAGWFTVPGAMLIIEAVKQASARIDAASEKSVPELTTELSRQGARMDFEIKQAKVSQELAIAQRIAEAETVSIEEHYDYASKSKLGLSTDGQMANAGLVLEGSRVSKRIYTFSGRNAPSENLQIDEIESE